MARKEHIVRHTDEELRAMQERGKDKSDWTQAGAMTETEIAVQTLGVKDSPSAETIAARMAAQRGELVTVGPVEGLLASLNADD